MDSTAFMGKNEDQSAARGVNS
ncbi:hypothetical protein C5167_015241 [Papaver somniferum]|uniref:Uncharacterized protein n=1 Tax=Papaver somniferum TaxID=3469 RepID=A0A4Y7J5G9_PAPSO|nr:hypothetical protein C5167_015241 [Papaver somniferum]